MAQVPPNPAVTSNLLSTQNALIGTLTSFLTVCIHHVLYLRRIYPPVSFLSTRAYNYPVRQNRHPAVCTWIQSAVDAVRRQLEKGTVEKVAICIFECEKNVVLERWTFDLGALPVVEEKEADTMFETDNEKGGPDIQDSALTSKVNVEDLNAQFRAVLSRLGSAAARLQPLPEGKECSFTLTIEVKADADRPVGRLNKDERKWVAAEPEPWLERKSQDTMSTENMHEKPGAKTVPVRRLEVGELRMELWVEESSSKINTGETSVQKECGTGQ